MYLPTTLTFWLCSTIYMTNSVSLSQSLTQSSPAEAIPSLAPSSKPNPTCTGPLTAANTAVAPILPGNRLVPAPYRLPDSFIFPHFLFFFTDFNIGLPRAAWATFCLDQCIAYIGNGTRTCRSFEVDQGVPYPPLPPGQNQDKRWWCEGFDVPLSAELYVPNLVEGTYGRFLGVNRLCGNETVRDY